MSYKKDSIYNTDLPVLIIDKKKKYNEYPQIGFGDEGAIHKFNDKIAFKTFELTTEKERLNRKFKKIEKLGKLKDENACFPMGLVGYEDLKKEGYYNELVHYNEEYKYFNMLIFLKDIRKKLLYIKQASDAIKRFHKQGIILGDIKGDNTLIDENDMIKFVDTDNWKYRFFDYDLEPGRSKWLKRTYEKDFSEEDNDKFVFGMMALQTFLNGTVIKLNDRYFKNMLKSINLSKETIENLRLIFSDANNKPYIGDILKDIDPEEKIIEEEKIYKLNRSIL